MVRINGAKVVVGGLLAGVLLNIGDFVINAVLLAEESRAALVRLNLDPSAMESGSVTMTWVARGFFAMGLFVKRAIGSGVHAAMASSYSAWAYRE